MGFSDDNPRLAIEHFMRAYFLVAKDVGDLTRIFCAALEEQNKKRRPALSSLLPGFLKPRTGAEDFYVENGRLAARANVFRRDPVEFHPHFPHGGCQGRRCASECAAHDHALARI